MTDTHNTTIDLDGTDTPVVVEYATLGWHEIEVEAVRIDMFGDAGPNIVGLMSKDGVEELEHEIIRSLPWNGRACRDANRNPGFSSWEYL